MFFVRQACAGAMQAADMRETKLSENTAISIGRFAEFVQGPYLGRLDCMRVSALLTVHEHIVSLLNKPDPVILDVGCNDGSDSESFLRLCPEAKLYCFEPDPERLPGLKRR